MHKIKHKRSLGPNWLYKAKTAMKQAISSNLQMVDSVFLPVRSDCFEQTSRRRLTLDQSLRIGRLHLIPSNHLDFKVPEPKKKPRFNRNLVCGSAFLVLLAMSISTTTVTAAVRNRKILESRSLSGLDAEVRLYQINNGDKIRSATVLSAVKSELEKRGPLTEAQHLSLLVASIRIARTSERKFEKFNELYDFVSRTNQQYNQLFLKKRSVYRS